MATELSILIADDHPIFRSGLRAVIEATPHLKVVAEAEDGRAALESIRSRRPRVAVLDLDMPNMDGLEVLREMRRLGLPTEVIVLTMHKSEAHFNAALDLGAKGYVLKDSALVEIISGIKAVSAGQSFFSPQMSDHLLKRRRRADALAARKPGLSDLTPAETCILRLIADDRTSREIADALFISVRTVEHHRANICAKLDLHGSNALLKFAVAHKSELSG
jgi:DNA-binding NarL/FixJ family response regulator